MAFGLSFPWTTSTGSVGGLFATASLNLDFTSGNQTLDPRITFTRASTATRTNSAGLIKSVAIDTPRFDYNPVTLASNGLLIEESRTNLVTYSSDFSNAAWAKANVTVTANTVVSPDGFLDGDNLVENTATSGHSIAFLSGTADSIKAISCYAKQSSGSRFLQLYTTGSSSYANFNISIGAITASSAGTATIQDVGNGWYRCSLTPSTSNFNYVAALVDSGTSPRNASYTGDGYSGIYIWGAQLEAGSFATSYIPTVASQVTRAADSASMTGTNFSDWYNPTEGTLYTKNTVYAFATGEVASLNDASSLNIVSLRYASGQQSQFSVTYGGANQVSIAPSGYSTPGVSYQRAAAFKLDDYAQAIDGGVPLADSSGILPTALTKLSIGSRFDGSAGFLNGAISQIAYFPRRFSNVELQGITA